MPWGTRCPYKSWTKCHPNAGFYAMGIVLVAIIAGFGLGILSYSPYGQPVTGVPTGPITVGAGEGQSCLYRGYINRAGGGVAPWGTVTFLDGQGKAWGSGTVTAATSGGYTTGVIPTGGTYYMYWNGTSVGTYPALTSVTIDKVTGLTEPANYYVSVPTMTVPWIAAAYVDFLVDNTYGALSAARNATKANVICANDTALVSNIPTSFSAGTTVTSAFATRFPDYMNPVFLSSGEVKGYMFIVTNSSNGYLGPGSPGTMYRIGSANTTFVIPLPTVTSSAVAATGSTQFSIVFPTRQHVTVYVYSVWNTNEDQLVKSNGVTATAPNGYTIGTFQIIGRTTATHESPIWAVA